MSRMLRINHVDQPWLPEAGAGCNSGAAGALRHPALARDMLARIPLML